VYEPRRSPAIVSRTEHSAYQITSCPRESRKGDCWTSMRRFWFDSDRTPAKLGGRTENAGHAATHSLNQHESRLVTTHCLCFRNGCRARRLTAGRITARGGGSGLAQAEVVPLNCYRRGAILKAAGGGRTRLGRNLRAPCRRGMRQCGRLETPIFTPQQSRRVGTTRTFRSDPE